jgi:sulfate transporter 4
LASIVVSGVLGLLDYPEAIYLWKVHKFDFMNWMVACLGTLFLGVEIGLAIAVGVSLLVVIYESAYPHTAVLGRLPGTAVYRNVKQYPKAECYDGLVLVRIDAPIYFANTQNVREKIRKYEERANEQVAERGGDDGEYVKYVILELSPVSHVDTSALHILHDMHKTYKAKNMQLCFCNPSPVVMERMVASGLVEEVGRDYLFVSIRDAVDHCLEEMDLQAMKISTQYVGDSEEDDSAENTASAQNFVDVEAVMQEGIFMNNNNNNNAGGSEGSDGDIGLNMDSVVEEEEEDEVNKTSHSP